MDTELKPLSMIYNEKSGFHANQKDDIYEKLMTIWTSHGFEIQVFDIGSEPDIKTLMQKIFQRHAQYSDCGVIVAAGGDGTLNAVASQMLKQKIPMGILPLGTFNYVARVLHIPLNILEAANVIATGEPRASHVACINDQIYLNNASLGLYPLFIKKREEYNRRFGRFPLNAYTSGLDVLIRDRKELKLEIEVDGQKYPVKTPLIFFGNNQLQLKELNLKISKCAEVGEIAGVVIAKGDKATLFKTLFQTIRGKLENASDVYSFGAQKVIVYSKKPKLTVAVDGEIVSMTTPLTLHVEKNALKLWCHMLLHLSDLHFGTERPECIRAIQKFCAVHTPEVVVVSGDLTQRAKFKEFYACKQFLESLNIPYFVVPGNHDIPLYHVWNRAFRPFGLYQLFFGSLERSLFTEHFYLIGMNSIRRRYHTRGHISFEQIQNVNQLLANAPKNKLKIIVSHQPFYTSNEDHHLKDCPALGQFAIKEWGQHQLYALLHGHLHLVAVYDLNQAFALNLKQPVYEVHAGTAVSRRLHKNIPNSFNVIHQDGGFEHYFFDEQLQEFIAKTAIKNSELDMI